MSKIGRRLREERTRLGKNQEDFALLGGVKRNAQARYERDERYPDAVYLAELAEAGVDVNYVITGVRFRPEIGDKLTAALQLSHQIEPKGGESTDLAIEAIKTESKVAEPPAPDYFYEREQNLIDNYRACNEADKQAVDRVVAAMAQQATGNNKE